jgi:hypothetical protein
VPAGLLNDHGPNTLAIAVWGLDVTSGGLDQVSAAGSRARYRQSVQRAACWPPAAGLPGVIWTIVSMRTS